MTASPAAPVTGDLPRVRITINSADLQTLQLLPGIGRVVAERIITERRERGRFRDIDDLATRVTGIGKKTGPALQPYVRFDE